MNTKISDDLVEEIKKKNNIVDVISKNISLIKQGKNYKGLCPFHNDTSPSMIVSPDKQIFKCFSCGAGGNVINFVMDYEKISFSEALKKLANNVGIEANVGAIKRETINPEQKEYLKYSNEAATLFSYLMENSDNEALNYLQSRNIDSAIIKYFRIGYGGRDNVLTNLFKSKNYDMNKVVNIGLAKIYNNDYQDVFNNRVVYTKNENKNKFI
jgi:DNA primase